MLCRFKHWLQIASQPGGNVASIGTDPMKTGSQKTNTSSGSNTSTSSDSTLGATAMITGSIPDQHSTTLLPDFPLFPLSKGFQITLKKLLVKFESTLREHGYSDVLS
jgi:hypothetical protein